MSDLIRADRPFQVKLVILSGRCGSGKTTTAYEICHILRSHKVMHVHIDGDNLDAMYPAEVTRAELLLENLHGMWSVFWKEAIRWWYEKGWAAKGRRDFVIVLSGTAMVLELERIKDTFTSVIAQTTEEQTEITNGKVAFEVYPFVLQASYETVEERLRRRELGGELDEHLKSTTKMAEELKTWSSSSREKSFRLLSEGRNVNEIAQEVIDVCQIL